MGGCARDLCSSVVGCFKTGAVCRPVVLAVPASMRKWLKEIILAQPALQLMDLVTGSAEFSLRCLLAVPHRPAVCALSSNNGWLKEGMMQWLFFNIGWLEHHCTRIVDMSGAEHRRAAIIAPFFGGPLSVRRSSLKKFISHTLLDVSGMAEEIAQGLFTCTD